MVGIVLYCSILSLRGIGCGRTVLYVGTEWGKFEYSKCVVNCIELAYLLIIWLGIGPKSIFFFQKGQLGHGDTIQRDRPTIVPELSKYVLICFFIRGNEFLAFYYLFQLFLYFDPVSWKESRCGSSSFLRVPNWITFYSSNTYFVRYVAFAVHLILANKLVCFYELPNLWSIERFKTLLTYSVML